MDSETTESRNVGERRNQQVDNAIRAIQEKKPAPEIDFTIHTMEDGSQVNTMERVCKGTLRWMGCLPRWEMATLGRAPFAVPPIQFITSC